MTPRSRPSELVGRSATCASLRTALVNQPPAAILVEGSFGVGRTRLVAAVADEQQTRRRTVQQLSAHRHHDHPFQVLAPFAHSRHLPPPVDFNQACDLLSGAETPAHLIIVDDAHELDEETAEVLEYLHRALGASMLATTRRGRRVPDALDAMWRGDNGMRVLLHPLDDADIGALCQQELGAIPNPVLIAEVARASTGRPLFVRELLREARRRNALLIGEGECQLIGRLDPDAAIGSLVRDELKTFAPPLRDAIETIALAGTMRADVAADLHGTAVLEALTDEGWLTTHLEAEAEPTVEPNEIRLGDLVAETIGDLRRRRHLTLLGALADHGATGMTPARAVQIRFAAGLQPTTDDLRATAMALLADEQLDRALPLARAAWVREQNPSDGALLGRVLAQLNAGAAAEDVFAEVDGLPTSDDRRARMTLVRAENLTFSDRDADARAVCREMIRAIGDPAAQDLVRAELANLWARRGQLHHAQGVLAERSDPPHPTSEVIAGLAHTLVSVWGGRPDPAVVPGASASAAAELANPDDVPPRLYELILLARGEAMCQAGRFQEAEIWLDELYACTVAFGIGYGVASTATLRGRIALERGSIATARCWFDRAELAFETFGLSRFIDQARVLHALVDARHGDPARASARLAARATARHDDDHDVLTPIEQRARAWIDHRLGENDRAGERLRRAATRLIEDGASTEAVGVLRDLAAMGQAGEALDLARVLRNTLQGPLLEGRVATVIAAAQGDIEGLDQSGRLLARIGAALDAADAFALAADAAARSGDHEQSRLCAARGLAAEAEAEGAHSRLLDRFRPQLDQLSNRERVIARLAAEGLASKVIAEKLSLSVRTVDNQLGSVYRKLGISGRGELTETMPSG